MTEPQRIVFYEPLAYQLLGADADIQTYHDSFIVQWGMSIKIGRTNCSLDEAFIYPSSGAMWFPAF
jgi:hypothetical protein